MDRQSLIGLSHFKNKDNILIIETATAQKANETVSEILEKYLDFKTALFLSGGNTPKKLYEQFANDKKIKAGAVGQIDERYVTKNNKNSNEKMITETGLIAYLENQNIRFYPILQDDLSIEDTARQYDEALRFIFEYFPKSVGILGIGEDGHTAGIPAIPQIALKMLEDQSELVDYYEAEKYGARITMNFHALSMLDLIIILALGQEKRDTLAQIFKEGMIDDMPARYFLRPGIAEKTIIVTDQII